MEKIVLQPGDRVETDTLTEEQYHAVAMAFAEAGTPPGEYPDFQLVKNGYFPYFGWYKYCGLYHSQGSYFNGSGPNRTLTVEQVLSTLQN